MTDVTLDNIGSGYNLSKINNNFDKLKTVINDEVIHTKGGNNTMSQDFDMNGKRILNLPTPKYPTDVVRVQDIESGTITVPAPEVITSNLTYIADIRATDLSGVDNFETDNYDVLGDNGGAPWVYTGTTDASKAGAVPDLVNGYVYDVNGRRYLFNSRTIRPEQFGVKSSNQEASVHIDCTVAMDNMIAFARLGAPQDGVTKVDKGGYSIQFPPRNEYERSGTLNLINFYVNLDFNGALIIQTTPTRIINAEMDFAGFGDLRTTYSSAVSYEDLYNYGGFAIEFSFNQINEINSETAFSEFPNIVIDRGYRGIGINSISAANAGLIWQTIFKRIDILNMLDYSYYFHSVTQTSTTVKFGNAHADCNSRDSVTMGSFSYFAKKHMLSTAPVEPEVTPGWEDYWDKQPVSGSRPAWASGVFYRTFGKGYHINNITTVKGSVLSMDGGHNVEDGSVLDTTSGSLNLDVFHLESHIFYDQDKVSMRLGSDVVFGQLWLGDFRRRMASATDEAALIGGQSGRNRNLTIEQVRNDGPNPTDTTGTLIYVDGGNDITAFNAITCGSGCPPHLTRNMPDETHYERPIRMVIVTGTGTPGDKTYSKGIKTYVAASAANPNYTVEREDSGALIVSAATGTFTVTLDRLVTPKGDTVRIVNNGAGTVALAASGTGTLDGATTAASDKILTTTRITDTIFLSGVSA